VLTFLIIGVLTVIASRALLKLYSYSSLSTLGVYLVVGGPNVSLKASGDSSFFSSS
jgi:hypothetical protein